MSAEDEWKADAARQRRAEARYLAVVIGMSALISGAVWAFYAYREYMIWSR